jgi:SAM-dependent methyltransferase
MSSDYEYRGMMAAAWDLLRGDTADWEDRPFFLAAIREFGQPALDVGCGTGRLLLDYLLQGVDVDGVDNSPEMLALCREKSAALGLNPRLALQEMQDLDLPRRFRTICVPSSSFQLVLDPADTAQAMRRFHDHLEPGGALLMPFIVMGRPSTSLAETWTKEATRPEDGSIIRRKAWSRYDPETGLEETRDDYELIRDGKVVATEHHERSPATRNYTLDQARSLYEAAGFAVTRVTGDFTDQPYDPAAHATFEILGVRS